MVPEQTRLLEKHFSDLARMADRSSRVVYSDFLNAQEQQVLLHLPLSQVTIRFFGGYEEAERKIASFCPLFLSEEDISYPLSVVRIHVKDQKFLSGMPSHRELLGAILGTGIDRAMTGDILIQKEEAFLFTTDHMAPYLIDQVTSAGKYHVELSLCTESVSFEEVSGTSMVVSLASLRLDAVLSRGFGMGRNEAQTWIRSGRAQVNHLPTEKFDQVIREGDLITLRGKGRLRIHEEKGLSKSGRHQIVIERFS